MTTPTFFLLLACGGEPGAKSDSGTEAAVWSAPPTPDFDMIEVASWTQEALPTGELPQGAQPGVAIGDLDGDGWLDAVMAYAGGSIGLRNDGTGGLVVDARISMDGGPLPGGMAIALADLDGDGDLDGHLGRWGAVDLLLWNDGTGAFRSEPLAGTEGATYSGSFADIDGDGDLDLLVAAGAYALAVDDILAGRERGDPNLVYRNDGGRFSQIVDALPQAGIDGISFHMAPLDADDDGDIDVYVANDAGPFVERNHLLLNDGTGHFTDAPAESGANLVMLAMGAAMGDANQDGLVDIYLSNVGPPRLLLNLGGGAFAEAAEARGCAIAPLPESLISWGTAFLDVDADFDHDLVVTFGAGGDQTKIDAVNPAWRQSDEQPSQWLVSDGLGAFARAPAPSFVDPGRTRAVAVGDLDRDGRPDVLTAGKHFLRQWRNTGGFEPGITLELRGAAGNPTGIGARIDVTVDGVTRTTWAWPSTTASSSAQEWYLGLADRDVAERIVVTWPNGTVTTAEDVPRGRLVLEEDAR